MIRSTAILCAALSLIVAFYAVVLDQWAGVTRYILFDVVVLGLAAVFGCGGWLAVRERWCLSIPALMALLLLFLSVVDTSPVKPALRAISQIRPGMTEAQVRSVLDQAFPEHGRFRRPNFGPVQHGAFAFVLDPSDGRYNAAVVSITFVNGRCTEARFLPD